MALRQIDINHKNYQQLGYEWVQDVLQDSDAPSEVNDDLSTLDEKIYVLGERMNPVLPNNYFGLYKKL